MTLLRDGIYSEIRKSILSLEFPPGRELREQHLAERYRVSRSPVRDALLRLGQEGFVTVLPRQGYRINDLSIDDIDSMCELCVLLEPACAAGAARAEDAVVATLDRYRNFRNEADLEPNYLDYDLDFHAAVAAMCGNRRIAGIEQSIIEELGRLVRYGLRLLPNFEVGPVVEEHSALIDAIQAHDSQEAARLAQEHVEARLMPLVSAMRGALTRGSDEVATPQNME